MTPPVPSVPVIDNNLTWCVSTALRDCLCAQLADVSAPAACCCLMPGETVVWDDCSNGQAWVRLAALYQTDQFPTATNGTRACGGMEGWAATFELGVIRCMPSPDETGALPTCEEYAETDRLVQADALAMLRTVMCCDWRTGCNLTGRRAVTGGWTPMGPEGGCVGGRLMVTVELSGCVCDPAPAA